MVNNIINEFIWSKKGPKSFHFNEFLQLNLGSSASFFIEDCPNFEDVIIYIKENTDSLPLEKILKALTLAHYKDRREFTPTIASYENNSLIIATRIPYSLFNQVLLEKTISLLYNFYIQLNSVA